MQTSQDAISTSTRPTNLWTIDPTHTSATFSVRHMMITNVRGEFQRVSGSVSYDPSRPDATVVRAAIDVASISTRDAQRDTHLRSADFFDVERFPTLTFASKAVRRSDRGFEIVGDLTIRDRTREVVLTVEGPTSEQNDPWGNVRVGAEATTKIKRSDFGITWNTVLETGGVLVGDEITIHLDVSLVKAKA